MPPLRVVLRVVLRAVVPLPRPRALHLCGPLIRRVQLVRGIQLDRFQDLLVAEVGRESQAVGFSWLAHEPCVAIPMAVPPGGESPRSSLRVGVRDRAVCFVLQILFVGIKQISASLPPVTSSVVPSLLLLICGLREVLDLHCRTVPPVSLLAWRHLLRVRLVGVTQHGQSTYFVLDALSSARRASFGSRPATPAAVHALVSLA